MANIRRDKKGFTLIEVALFLILTTAITAAVVGSLIESVRSQRYRDTSNDFSEFMRRVYSDVANTENVREDGTGINRFCSIASMWNGDSLVVNNPGNATLPGRSNCVIYGKAVTFGEQDAKKIYEYDIIGTIYNGGAITDGTLTTTISSLISTKSDIVGLRGKDQDCRLSTAGNSDSYTPQWDGWAEDKDGNFKKGTLIIVRSPLSGTVETYFMDNTIEVQSYLDKDTATTSCENPATSFAKFQDLFLQGHLAAGEFKQDDFYLCIESDDRAAHRRALKIEFNGNNASAVELLDLDDAMSQEVCP